MTKPNPNMQCPQSTRLPNLSYKEQVNQQHIRMQLSLICFQSICFHLPVMLTCTRHHKHITPKC